MSVNKEAKPQLVGLTQCFAYVFLRHIYLPPEEGGQEATKNEWLKVEVSVKKMTDRTVVVYPHHKLQFAASAIILDNGEMLKFRNFPNSYMGKIVNKKVLTKLDELAWDIRKMRCKDCPEFPWKTLFDGEMIDMRVEDSYETYERMERYYNSNEADEINADFNVIREMVLDTPVPLG